MRAKKQTLKPGDEVRTRLSKLMRQLNAEGITQERMARGMSDERSWYSVSAVQKWSNGTNLPDCVSVGQIMAWLGRKGWLMLWVLGFDSAQMRELAEGIKELLDDPGAILRVGQATERDRENEKLLSALAKTRGAEARTPAIRDLAARGVPLARIAETCGVSRQRVWQIVNSERKEPSGKR